MLHRFWCLFERRAGSKGGLAVVVAVNLDTLCGTQSAVAYGFPGHRIAGRLLHLLFSPVLTSVFGVCSLNYSFSMLAVCSTAPENPRGGAFSCPTNTTAGSNCTATCSIGFFGTPAPKVTCLADGSWTNANGACTRGRMATYAWSDDLQAWVLTSNKCRCRLITPGLLRYMHWPAHSQHNVDGNRCSETVLPGCVLSLLQCALALPSWATAASAVAPTA